MSLQFFSIAKHLKKKKTLLQFTKHGYNCHISLHCAEHYFIAKGHSKPICQKEKDTAITSTKMKFPFSIPFCQDSQKSKELCHKLMLMLNVPESQMRRSHQNISYKQQISTTSVFTVHCKNWALKNKGKSNKMGEILLKISKIICQQNKNIWLAT